MKKIMDVMERILVLRIKKVLEELEIEYSDNGEGIIGFTSPQVSITFEVEADGWDYRLQVGREVSAGCVEDILWYLNQANLITPKGHWELAGNHVCFRIHTDRVINKEVSENRIYEVLQRGEAAAEKFYEGIMMICAEGFSGPEAFEEFVVKQSTEM